MRNCLQIERKKNRGFRRLRWIPAIKDEDRDKGSGGALRCRVEIREGIRISATRWSEDDSTICLGVASGLTVIRPAREVHGSRCRIIPDHTVPAIFDRLSPPRLLNCEGNRPYCRGGT